MPKRPWWQRLLAKRRDQLTLALHATPSHHLYVCPVDSDELRRHRLFRDYLISHPETANAYGTLKKAAAALHRENRTAYTQAKSEFVTEVLLQARIASPLKARVPQT